MEKSIVSIDLHEFVENAKRLGVDMNLERLIGTLNANPTINKKAFEEIYFGCIGNWRGDMRN